LLVSAIALVVLVTCNEFIIPRNVKSAVECIEGQIDKCTLGGVPITESAKKAGIEDGAIVNCFVPENLAENLEAHFPNPVFKFTKTRIVLSGEGIGLEECKVIGQALADDGPLKTLVLAGNKISDTGAAAIAAALPLNGGLTYLNLGGNSIADVGAAAIAGALPFNGGLKSLNLHSNEIGDVGAQALAASGFGGLKTLYLWSNNIGDVGAAALAEALKVNGELTVLILGGNDITDIGAQALAASGFGGLTILELTGNKISKEAKDIIEAAWGDRGTLRL